MRTKLQNFLRSNVEGVYTIQNGAYERNGLTAYSVGSHNILLNWMTRKVQIYYNSSLYRLNLGQIMHHENVFLMIQT